MTGQQETDREVRHGIDMGNLKLSGWCCVQKYDVREVSSECTQLSCILEEGLSQLLCCREQSGKRQAQGRGNIHPEAVAGRETDTVGSVWAAAGMTREKC